MKRALPFINFTSDQWLLALLERTIKKQFLETIWHQENWNDNEFDDDDNDDREILEGALEGSEVEFPFLCDVKLRDRHTLFSNMRLKKPFSLVYKQATDQFLLLSRESRERKDTIWATEVVVGPCSPLQSRRVNAQRFHRTLKCQVSIPAAILTNDDLWLDVAEETETCRDLEPVVCWQYKDVYQLLTHSDSDVNYMGTTGEFLILEEVVIFHIDSHKFYLSEQVGKGQFVFSSFKHHRS